MAENTKIGWVRNSDGTAGNLLNGQIHEAMPMTSEEGDSNNG